MGHLDKQRELRFTEVMLIVRTILSAASVIAGGKVSDKLQDALTSYENLVYPELTAAKVDKTKDVAAIMKREFERGPMKVQAQEYDTGKKRRRKPR